LQARGGGAELVAAADLTFAAKETARLGQVEALMVITPVAAPPSTCWTVWAATAPWNWSSPASSSTPGPRRPTGGSTARCLPPSSTPTSPASRGPSPPHADGVIAAAKQALPTKDFGAVLVAENDAWASPVTRRAARRLMSDALKADAQTVEGERDLEGHMRGVA
jgi:hypothetical protein